MAAHYPMAYIWATYEDLVGEWAQWYYFLAAFILSVRLSFSSNYRPFFVILAIACFYVVMEEISWGQRIFGFGSPEFFAVHNLQRETNLHNLIAGPYSTAIKDLIEYSLAAALVLFGFVYPLVLKKNWIISQHLSRWVPAPPLYLWPFFVTGAVLELGPFHFNEAEIAELLIGAALAIMTLHYYYHGTPIQFIDPVKQPGNSKRLALSIGVLTSAVLIFSLVTTTAIYAIPHIQVKIDNRIVNGIEKFAGRYVRYDKWATAAQLYERLHFFEPQRSSVLRKLAKCLREMGDRRGFELWVSKAIANDSARYRIDPNSISVNQSLARSYRLFGQYEESNEHLAKALSVALERVERQPNSASAAYWLGKVYQLLDRETLAAEQFNRAYELKPTSSKYRKAAFETQTELAKTVGETKSELEHARSFVRRSTKALSNMK